MAEKPKEREYTSFTVEYYKGKENGRSYITLTCSCGAYGKAYKWSWAGHGARRCKHCGKWHSYYDLR